MSWPKSLCLLTAIALEFGLLVNAAAAQASDAEQVKAALDAFHTALSSLDIDKMDAVWAHDADVMLANPTDKSISVGWDAIKKNWEATFNFWSRLKITTRTQGPIRVSGNVAWSMGLVDVDGKARAAGGVGSTVVMGVAPTFEADIFEKRGDRWLMVSHGAWRVPY